MNDEEAAGSGEEASDDRASGAGPSETLEELGLDVPAIGEPSQEPATESRSGRFFRRALRWAAAVLAIFALGFAATWVARVRPLQQEQSSLEEALAESEAEQAELQTELERLKGVEADNEILSEELDEAATRLALLSVLVDVTSAQLALAQEDPLRVAVALEGTEDRLSELGDLLGPDSASDLEGLQERLILVIYEVDEDPFAAERDLEVLANTLLGVERGLFGN